MTGVTNRKNPYSNSTNRIIFITSVIYLLLSFVPASMSFAQDGGSNTQADLAWAEFDGEDLEIYYGYFSGGVWGPKIQLSHNRSEDIFPSISSGADGAGWVVWSAFDGSNSMLFFSSNFGENTWSVPQKISTHLTSNTAPSIVVDNSNTPWIVWAGNNGQDDEIYFTRWNGRSWDEPTQVNREDTTPDILPKIGIDANGNPFVIWSGYDGEKYNDYFCSWGRAGWEDESIAADQMYRSLIEDSGRQIPELPEYLTDPDSASIHIRGTGQIQSIRLYDINKPPSESLENYSDVESEYQSEGVENVFIAFGDSITQGYPEIDEPGEGRQIGGYEPHLETLLEGPSQTTKVLNYGLAGEHTSEGLNRIDEILSREKSSFILILEGTNDILLGISRSTTYANLREMIDKSRANNVTPILATLTQDSRPLPNFLKDIKGTYNPIIREIADEKEVMLADLYEVVLDQWSALSDDGIHPNDAGHQVIAEEWFDAIKSEVPKVTTSGTIAVDDTEATISGFINPNNFPTSYYFEYGSDTTYGGLTAVVNAGSGNEEISVSADLSNLNGKQVYHFRLVAYNDFVKNFGENQSFETFNDSDKKR